MNIYASGCTFCRDNADIDSCGRVEILNVRII